MPRAARSCLIIALIVLPLLAGLVVVSRSSLDTPEADEPMRYTEGGRVRIWWDTVSAEELEAFPTFKQVENIHRENYVGSEACKKCHSIQYESWSEHPHRWMNALADESTVLGDFSGDSPMHYLGGVITSYRTEDAYRIRLERGNVRRVYEVTQTIGRRFFQYYVGKQIEGPEQPGHPYYEQDHVLPVGYWLDYEEWVPTVHISGDEAPDGQRSDPFYPDMSKRDFPIYAQSCNFCHTTFPLSDMMIRYPIAMGKFSPMSFHFLAPQYLAKHHPNLWPAERDQAHASSDEIMQATHELYEMEAPSHAVTLGISCEACHLGAKAHAEGKLTKPLFFASGHELLCMSMGEPVSYERTQENVNWICGRCHTGLRPQLAAGMSTWNSTEAEDAARSACYPQLSCIDCHNPHEGIGKKWTRTPDQDDAACLKCHQQFQPDEARMAHTHHPIGSSGSRCMNCHMPKLNEGMQDVVRTHMIFSPTNALMIESNEPNACNQCHVKESIDWTLGRLKEWYGAEYSRSKIAQAYPSRRKPATIGWLESEREQVRLIAAHCLTEADARWALPDLLKSLDDPYLLNRQFARRGIEKMLDVKLEDFGYRFYMTPAERKQPLQLIRHATRGE
jgi:predicted CXXCH cytochrome family protein